MVTMQLYWPMDRLGINAHIYVYACNGHINHFRCL